MTIVLSTKRITQGQAWGVYAGRPKVRVICRHVGTWEIFRVYFTLQTWPLWYFINPLAPKAMANPCSIGFMNIVLSPPPAPDNFNSKRSSLWPKQVPQFGPFYLVDIACFSIIHPYRNISMFYAFPLPQYDAPPFLYQRRGRQFSPGYGGLYSV